MKSRLCSIVLRFAAAPRKIGPWRIASILLLLLVIPLAVRLALDSGISWDEEKQLEYGKRLLGWYRSGFTDRSSFTFMDLYLYGGLFDLPAQIVISSGLSPWGAYETRHVLTALLAVLGIVAVWMTANRIAGPRAGLFAAVLLALTPAWVGHGLFNCKDIPFAAASAFVIYFLVRVAMRSSPLTWADAFGGALSTGCALGVRSGGMFLFAYPILIVLSRWVFAAHARRGDPVRATREAAVALGRLLCALPLAWGMMLVAWPWAQVSPVMRPLEAAAIARHFAWSGLMRFDGGMVSTSDLPLSYLPVWFEVTLPDVYVAAGLCAAVLCLAALKRKPRTQRVRAIAVLLSFIVIPYLAIVITRPVIYDAHRHFLFLLPAIAVVAGLAIEGFTAAGWVPWSYRAAMVSLLIGTASLTVCDMRSLHPYEYLYFNRLSGGLPRQAARFETDYWGLSYREAFAWVVRHVAVEGSHNIRVAACNIPTPLRYYRQRWNAKHFIVEERLDRAQVSIAMLRGECRDVAGTVIHAVERQGVPLAFVRRRHSASSYLDSCRNCAVNASRLNCECRAASGQWSSSSLRLPCPEIANQDGRLQCR